MITAKRHEFAARGLHKLLSRQDGLALTTPHRLLLEGLPGLKRPKDLSKTLLRLPKALKPKTSSHGCLSYPPQGLAKSPGFSLATGQQVPALSQLSMQHTAIVATVVTYD